MNHFKINIHIIQRSKVQEVKGQSQHTSKCSTNWAWQSALKLCPHLGHDNICPFPDWVSLSESLMSSRSFKDGTVTESPKSESALSGGFDSFLGTLCWEEGVLLSVWRWLLSTSFIFCAAYIASTFVPEWPWSIDIWPLTWPIGKLFGGLCSAKWLGPLAANCVYKYGQKKNLIIQFPLL